MSFRKNEKDELLKIAIYGHKTIPSREGGIEVVVQEISVRMAARGYEVTCLNRGGKHDVFEDTGDVTDGTYHGVRLETLPTIDRNGLAAASSSFFAALEAALGPYDVVHIHAEGPAAFCWIPKLFGKRVVVTVHGLDWQREKWKGFAKEYIHFGEKMAVSYADQMIVLSNGMKKYFKEQYDRETVYIPNGISPNPSVSPDLIRTKFGLEKDGYLLYLGRLVPEKKADILLEAFKKTRTDKKLVIAGPDSTTDEYICRLHELAGDDPRIIFTGFVKDKLFAELMSNAYTYVLPSKLEGMPLSLLEAMSYGNCCVTSDIPECLEVIGDHGITVNPEDVTGLQSSIQYLLDNPSVVEKYKTDAKEFIRSRENWDEVVAQTLNLYRKNPVKRPRPETRDRGFFKNSANVRTLK